MIKRIILILALFLSMGLTAQEHLTFTKRPLHLTPYSVGMALPITAFSLLYKGETDKLLHFGAGYGVTAFTGYVLRKKGAELWLQILGGLASGYFVGFGKELSDKYFNTGVYSKRDINATIKGSTLATFTFMIVTRDITTPKFR